MSRKGNVTKSKDNVTKEQGQQKKNADLCNRKQKILSTKLNN